MIKSWILLQVIYLWLIYYTLNFLAINLPDTFFFIVYHDANLDLKFIWIITRI